MGIKLNLGCGIYMKPGFLNLDIFIDESGLPEGCEVKKWDARDGLPEIKDNSVEAITMSHFLYAIEETSYPMFFKELYRVLEKGGIVRITDDNYDQPPEMFNKFAMGRPGMVTHTTRPMLWKYLGDAGFEVHDASNRTTFYKDDSLMQEYHGGYIKVFYVEGIKK